jgi:transposase-like protein
MTTREIVAIFKEMYDADVSPTLISKVTDVVKEQVTEWQNRPLDSLYPIVFFDCIVVKVRQNVRVINKAVFLVLEINTEGKKELLDMWLAENKGAKFWLNVLTGLKNRGLQDILAAYVDGLKYLPVSSVKVSSGEKSTATQSLSAPVPDGYHAPVSAREQLATPRREQWLQMLWDYSSLPKNLY